MLMSRFGGRQAFPDSGWIRKGPSEERIETTDNTVVESADREQRRRLISMLSSSFWDHKPLGGYRLDQPLEERPGLEYLEAYNQAMSTGPKAAERVFPQLLQKHRGRGELRYARSGP